MGGYFQSSAGRALVLAAGVFLTGLGLASLLAQSDAGPIVAMLAPVAAVGVAIACVELGMDRFPLRSLAVTAISPLILVPAFVAATARGWLPSAAGHVLVAGGVATLAAFVMMSLLSQRGAGHAGRASGAAPSEDVRG